MTDRQPTDERQSRAARVADGVHGGLWLVDVMGLSLYRNNHFESTFGELETVAELGDRLPGLPLGAYVHRVRTEGVTIVEPAVLLRRLGSMESGGLIELRIDPSKYDDWIPKDATLDDGAFLPVALGRYQPNAWGIHDMHGNVAEWTASTYEPYPYRPLDGREDLSSGGRKVVRGGSWHDRPFRCTSSFRIGYQPYQPVYNVGFRVVCEDRSRQRSIAPVAGASSGTR